MNTISLTQKQIALVDDEDFQQLNQHKWYAIKNHSGEYDAVRACRCWIDWRQRHIIRMSRQIMSCPQGLQVDHQDNNGLNNQRYNLRICTGQQNRFNMKPFRHSSKYKGVFWHKKGKFWTSQIRINSKRTHLGCFTNEIEAAKAYDNAAIKYQGEFAWLNFPL